MRIDPLLRKLGLVVTERQGPGLYSGGREAALLVVVLLVGGCGPSAPAVPLPADWSLVPSPAHPRIREAVDRCRADPRDPAAFEALAAIYHGNDQTALAAQSYEIALTLGSRSARRSSRRTDRCNSIWG